MFKSISPLGMELFTKDYCVVENTQEADAILVRSASMHDMELPDQLEAVARAGAGVNIFLWINVPRKVLSYLIRPERMPTALRKR